MKASWCLGTSCSSDLSAAQSTAAYGKRFCIEETFWRHHTRSLRLDTGLVANHIGLPERCDRLLLLVAMA